MASINITDLNNAKLDVDHIAEVATSTADTATDRLGHVKKTLAGAVGTIAAINNRGAWVTGTAYALKDLVSNSGTWYICVSAHTAGSTFAGDVASKWRVYQGVIAEDLSNSSDPLKGVTLVAGAGRVVSSISALRALPKSGSTNVCVTGYYSAGDGGGGFYYYDAADTSSADNGGTIIVATDGGRWKLAVESSIDVRQFGLKADGVTDNTQAFNNALAACKNLSVKRLCFPVGSFKFNSKPSNIDFGVELVGSGMNGTVLIRNYNQGGFTGFLEFVAGANGASARSMAIEAASGTAGGSAVRVLSDASNAVSALVFEDLWLSTFGTDTWTSTFIVDGSAKTSAPSGARDIALRNVHIFGATSYSLVLNSAVGFTFMGGGIYPAGATGALTGGIQVAGSVAVPSQYIDISISTCGVINLTNCANVEIHAPVVAGAIENANTASDVLIVGTPSGAVQNNWTRGAYIADMAYLSGVNGHLKLPNGMILQWMTVSATASTTNFNWPRAFPNNCFSVSLSGANANYFPYHTAFSTATVTVGMSTGHTGSSNVRVLGIGN